MTLELGLDEGHSAALNALWESLDDHGLVVERLGHGSVTLSWRLRG